MKIYNSLTKKKEAFTPLKQAGVGVYTCGPTVYDYVTIGNWRTYMLGDLLVRSLTYLGYEVAYVMNITDVGHLTGDNLGDADLGEDRMEKSAQSQGKTAWEVAEFYANDFLKGYELLNLTKPQSFCKATDHIEEQIALVQQIENAGFAYRIDDGVYFDVGGYEKAGNSYGELSTLDKIREGARVEPIPGKRGPKDFALWKLSHENEQRHMEWDSPWGKGFPGWHIECSAMSMKYLGEQFDVHVGGEDLKSTHHPNEIAQSEAATGKRPFVNYWVHGAFLTVDGGRMGKSLGNAYTLQDLEKKGYEPMALRYFYLTGHYRKPLNFTFEALESAQTALANFREMVVRAKNHNSRQTLSDEKMKQLDKYRADFGKLIADDLRIPDALALGWELMKSNIPSMDKYDLMLEFDAVLGLGLKDLVEEAVEIDPEGQKLLEQRKRLRAEGKFEEADLIRQQLQDKGYLLEDTPEGVTVRKK